MIAGGFDCSRRHRGKNGWRSANSKERRFVFTHKLPSVIRHFEQRASLACSRRTSTLSSKAAADGDETGNRLLTLATNPTAAPPACKRPACVCTGREPDAWTPSIPGPETWPQRYRAFKVSLSEGNGLPWWDGERGEDKISEDKQAL